LSDFILNHADENAIFYLIGDHQPPSVSRRADTFYTPIHIVSRDPAYLKNLEQYGFVNSLIVDDTQPSELRHEGLYSLIVRTLIQTYGTLPSFAPPYLPEGVVPPDWITSVAEEETE
jgi:hypothetical protein